MRGLKVGLVFVAAVIFAWLVASSTASEGAVSGFGAWEGAFMTLGSALGVAGVRAWRLHERLPHDKTHLVLGGLLFGLGVAGTMLVGYDSPFRTFAPVMTTIGVAWGIVGLAATRQARH